MYLWILQVIFKVIESGWNTANDDDWHKFLTYIDIDCIDVKSRFKFIEPGWNTANDDWHTFLT